MREGVPGQKPMIAAMLTGPGPAAHTPVAIDSTSRVKRAPAFSFGAKLKPLKTAHNPGPGQYKTNVLRTGSATGPSYSITGRGKGDLVRKDAKIIPGPGAHNLPSRLPHQRQAPSYSMSSRKEQPSGVCAPAANKYNVGGTVGRSGPSYSLSGAWEHGDEKAMAERSPGPAAYLQDDRVVQKAEPKYSLSSRTPLLHEKGLRQNPGPGSYDPSLHTTLKSAPQFTMRTHHSPYKVQPKEANVLISEELGFQLTSLPRFHGHQGKPLRAQSASARASAGRRNVSAGMSRTLLDSRPATRAAADGSGGRAGEGGGIITTHTLTALPALGSSQSQGPQG